MSLISLRSTVLALLALVATASAEPLSAGAGAESPLARLVILRREALKARGPAAYVTLRKLWSEWDRLDPGGIEEVLHEVAGDAAEPASLRVYAGLLEAYARRRRGDLNDARARIARLGYVSHWMLLGPFDNDGKTGLSTRYEPEGEGMQPINVAHDYEGKDHKRLRWRVLPAVSPYAWVDFGAFVRPQESICVYATTFVRDARIRAPTSRPLSIWAGAAGAMRLQWNGVEVISDEKYRDLDSDRVAVAVSAREGWNRLTAKVCGDDRTPMLSLRVASASGEPDDHIEVDADPSRSTRQGGAVEAAPMRHPAGRVEGPLQAFERLAKEHDAGTMETYARYLETTGADDPTEHRARELARMAADKAPTVARLLLAARVAESRNQRGVWIDRAESLLAAGPANWQDRIDMLLARAEYARTGVNAREAVPYYEQVLALDPQNVPALLARVELYEDAGLRETALASLQNALVQQPRSVGLLRSAVAALREVGRETEADEMAERYAALRFDDVSFIRGRIELAIARRQPQVVEHWIDRLLSANPDNAAALQAAARAWIRMGDRTRAIATYRTALDVAPDDTDAMRQLANLYDLANEHDEQLRLLKRVLELVPQAKAVRDEVAHIGPATARPDEEYLRPSSEFLAGRSAPSAGQARRALVELQVTSVFPNGLASRLHQVVYQPLTDAAAAQSREYEFTYETDAQTVQVRAARVYRKDGRIDEAIENGAGAMADDPALAIYTTARSYYIRFPRLDPGDVVELQYRVEDIAARNAFADYFGEVVTMQSSESIARAEYILITPKARAFVFNEPRIPGLERGVEQRGDQRIFRFLAHDVPPIEEEPNQPAWAEVLGHVNVSTYKAWEEMGRWYWGLVKDQFVPDDEVRRRAEALTKGLKDEKAKVRAIYDYVVQKTRYVALEFGIHGYKPYRCAQIFARGFGDCKDKATLIVTMLGALGIRATPVIVRSANKGDIETAPASLAPFDHMIAYVPSLDLYLDGTAEYTGSLELPAMDRGALALQVNEGNAKLLHLPDPPASASVSTHDVDVTMAADGSARIDWRAGVSGVDASAWRVRFHAQATRKQRVQDMIDRLLPGSDVVGVDAGDFEDIEQPVQIRLRGSVPQFARSEGDLFTLPLGRKEHMVRDYASLTARKLDVRLQAQWTEEDAWTLRLPPGFKVTSAPAPAAGSSPFGSYALEVAVKGSVLYAKTTVALNQTRILAKDYPAFRRWCEEIDRVLGQRALVANK